MTHSVVTRVRERIADHVQDCPRCGPLAKAYHSLERRLGDLSAHADPESVVRLEGHLSRLTSRHDRPDDHGGGHHR